jgi:hypothetical protein
VPRRKLVVFGNLAVGPIAIGNVAVGYVAIGLSLAVGPVAIGINSLGFLLAVGLNAVGVASFAAVNGVGAITFAGVNALGALSHAGVNNGTSPFVGLALAMAEAWGAHAMRPSPENRAERLVPGLPLQEAKLLLRSVTEDALEYEGGTLRFDDSFTSEQRAALQTAFRASRYPLASVGVQTTVRTRDDEGYREAPDTEAIVSVVSARLLDVGRWYAPVFRSTLLVGAVLAALCTLAALLR